MSLARDIGRIENARVPARGRNIAVAPLRIAVDVRALMDRPTGIGRYTAQVVRAWRELAPCGLVLFTFGGQKTSPALDALLALDDVELVRHPLPMRAMRRLWQTLRAPRIEDFTGPVDLVVAAETAVPPTRAPVVAFVYDALWADHPEWFNRYVRRAGPENLRDVDAHARLALCISDTTRREVLRLHPSLAGRLHVVAPSFGADAPLARRDPEPRVLFVGTREPRKGLGTLAAALLRGEGAASELALSVVGPPGWGTLPDARALDALSALGRADVLGFVSEARLARLRASALACVVPSLDEGFGLPLLEAMAAGVPVVASDIPVFREVGGDAFLAVPPGDPGALADALTDLAGSPARRRALADAGRRQAERWAPGRQRSALADALRHLPGVLP